MCSSDLTGAVFVIPKDGPREKLLNALSESETRVYNDALSIFDSILPDNDNFTVQDATDWEVRLGMINGSGVAFDERKAAIIRKMNHPGDIKARQSADYLEQSLHLANFNVYIHENLAGLAPQNALVLPANIARSGQRRSGDGARSGNVFTNFSSFFSTVRSGQRRSGDGVRSAQKTFTNVLANHIDEDLDKNFSVGGFYKATFFVGGPVFGTTATVPIGRKEEFRQLILKIKPVHTVGYLFINYI